MKNLRVMIVEDDVALRRSLTDWLSTEYMVTAFESAEALMQDLHLFESQDPSTTCILLDFQMGGATGVELQMQLLKKNIQFPIIFMSGNAQQADIIDAWHGGAVDFLLKPFTGSKVSETIEALFQRVVSTHPPLSPSVHERLVDIPISQREAQVLLLLGAGHRQHEIAKILNISLRTIKWHRASLKNKLNLNTLVELTRYCDQNTRSIEAIVHANIKKNDS
jgi:FixJ family two-component response regulator